MNAEHKRITSLIHYYVKLTARMERVIDAQFEPMQSLLDSGHAARSIDGLQDAVEHMKLAKTLYGEQFRTGLSELVTAAKRANASLAPYSASLEEKIWANCDATLEFLRGLAMDIERVSHETGRRFDHLPMLVEERPNIVLSAQQRDALIAVQERIRDEFAPAFLRLGNDYSNMRNATTGQLTLITSGRA